MRLPSTRAMRVNWRPRGLIRRRARGSRSLGRGRRGEGSARRRARQLVSPRALRERERFSERNRKMMLGGSGRGDHHQSVTGAGAAREGALAGEAADEAAAAAAPAGPAVPAAAATTPTKAVA